MLPSSPAKVASRKVLPTQDSNSSLKNDQDAAEKDNEKNPISPTPHGGKASLLRRGTLMRQTTSFKYMYALEQMKAQSEHEHDSIDDLRIQTKKFMTNSFFGKVYENVLILLSLLSAVTYIHETYALDTHNLYLHEAPVLDKIDILFAAIFGFDWLFNLFLADSRFYYFWSVFSWVDIVIIISILVTRGHTVPRLHDVNTFYNGMMYSFFFFRTVRILRALRFYTKFSGIRDPVDRFATQLGFIAGTLMVFFAAAMEFFERNPQPRPVHTWLYFVTVTVATVGYGDITPVTAGGRVCCMTLIGFAVISVPLAVNELIAKMKLQSVYMRAAYTAKSRNAKHILICGDLSSTSISDFFAELFHEDHENADLNAVILLPQPPTVELILLIQSQQYFLSITYLQGSALHDNDLKRAKAESASAIFVMTNKFSHDPDEEDTKSILLNLSIKRYIASFFRPRLLFCVQLLRPENRRHLTKSHTNELDDSDIVVCLNEIKMGAMAQAALCPGAITLLMTLLTSFSDDDLNIDESELPIEEIPTGNNTVVRASPKAWFDEYFRGCGWEIYITKLSRVFDGAKFCELSYSLYEKKGVVLFALQLKDRKASGAVRLVLNPGHFVIPSQQDYEIEAFVIAKNKATSDLSFSDSDPASISDHSALHLMSRNLGSVAFIMKSAADVMERRKSSLKDVNKLRAHMTFANKLDSVGEEDDSHSTSDHGAVKKESRWKTLKRSALLERKIKSDSFQEVIHRLEDEHFNHHYYVRSTAIRIEDVTVKTDIISEIPSIMNHIIVVAKNLKNLFDLLRPLRAKHLGPMKYIVVLHPHDIPIDVWRRISVLDGLIFVRGSSLDDSSLKRAGIFRASTVIFVADGSSEEGGSAASANLVDSDAIFSYQHVKRLNPLAHIVVEIVNQSNINYLEDQNNPSLVEEPQFSPPYAAGSLFTTGLLDSIVCQAYYNPEIVKVINKLIAGMDQLERSHFILKAAEELGHVEKAQLSSSDESDDSASENEDAADEDGEEEDNKGEKSVRSGTSKNSKKNPKKPPTEALPPELLLHKARRKLLKIPNSCLYQIGIPDKLETKTYGALFQFLAAQGMIPLGIYRGLYDVGLGPRANRMPYVYTNPPKETELYPCDLIFVLSTKPERATSKLEVTDWLSSLQSQHRARDLQSAVKSRMTHIANTGAQRDTILKTNLSNNTSLKLPGETYEVSYKKLEEKFKNFTTHLDQKLLTVIESMEKVLEDNGGMITGPTTARTSTFDDGMSMTSGGYSMNGSSRIDSTDVDFGNSARFSIDTTAFIQSPSTVNGGNEEKKLEFEDAVVGRSSFLSPIPPPSAMITNSPGNGNSINPLSGVFPRKNSVKKRLSNPLVPAIYEESQSSGQSTVHSEEDESDAEKNQTVQPSTLISNAAKQTLIAQQNLALKGDNDAHYTSDKVPFLSNRPNARETFVAANLSAAVNPSNGTLLSSGIAADRPHRQTVITSQDKSTDINNKLPGNRGLRETVLQKNLPNTGSGFVNRNQTRQTVVTKSNLVGEELHVPPGRLESAVSNLSMDFSVAETENEEEGAEEVMLDVSPLQPIKFESQAPPVHDHPSSTIAADSKTIVTEPSDSTRDKQISQIKELTTFPLVPTLSLNKSEEKSLDEQSLPTKGVLLNEQKVREQINSTGLIEAKVKTSPPFFNQNDQVVTGPKLASVSPLSVDRLAKVKSLTDFVDTKSGKIRSTIVGRPGSASAALNTPSNNDSNISNPSSTHLPSGNSSP